MNRRTYLQLCGAAVCSTAFRICSKAETSKFTMPGLYPGRVVAAESAASVHGGKLAKDPIRSMLQKGMCELTGAPAWQDAWRQFFEPGDVVGIKINPCGYPVCTGPEVLMPVIEGITSAGVKMQDIVVYERYQSMLVQSGTMKWLPAGLRVMHAAEAYTDIQTGIDGYDPDLIRPLYDEIVHQSVDSYRRECQGQERKDGDQRCLEPTWSQHIIDRKSTRLNS